MRKTQTILFLSFFFLLLLSVASASLIDKILPWPQIPLGRTISAIWNAIFHNVPVEFKTWPEFIYFVIIPFIGTFTIAFGILKEVGVFRHVPRVNIIIALIFAFSMLYYGALTMIVHLLYSLSGFIVVMFFGALFILGTFLLGFRKKAEWKKDIVDVETLYKHKEGLMKEIKKVEADLKDVREDLAYEVSGGATPSELKKLKKREVELQQRLNELRTQLAALKTQEDVAKSRIIE